MAIPISLDRSRVEHPPVPYAAASQSALELLQALHEQGVLELLRGLVGGGGFLVTRLSEGAATPEAICAFRNVLSLAKILGRIDPEVFDQLLKEPPAKAPGIFSILKKVVSPDTRRGVSGALAFAAAFGKALAPRLKD